MIPYDNILIENQDSNVFIVTTIKLNSEEFEDIVIIVAYDKKMSKAYNAFKIPHDKMCRYKVQ